MSYCLFILFCRLHLSENDGLPQHLQRDTYYHASTQALLQDIAVVAEQRYEKVRSAVLAWFQVARHHGVLKDVARLIGVMLWATKEDVEW